MNCGALEYDMQYHASIYCFNNMPHEILLATFFPTNIYHTT